MGGIIYHICLQEQTLEDIGILFLVQRLGLNIQQT